MQNVGFIGLGNMGFHMAKNLINAGYKLTVHDMYVLCNPSEISQCHGVRLLLWR